MEAIESNPTVGVDAAGAVVPELIADDASRAKSLAIMEANNPLYPFGQLPEGGEPKTLTPFPELDMGRTRGGKRRAGRLADLPTLVQRAGERRLQLGDRRDRVGQRGECRECEWIAPEMNPGFMTHILIESF